MKQQYISAIMKSVETQDLMLSKRQRKEIRKKNSGKIPVMIELLVPCRGRGRPVKCVEGKAVDLMRNFVIKPKTFNLH